MFANSFSKKVYLLVTLLVAFIMSSAASYFLITQHLALKGAMAQQAQSLSVSLADGIRIGVILEDKDFIEQVANGLLGLPNLLFIDVYHGNGSLLVGFGDTKHQLEVPKTQLNQTVNKGFFASPKVKTNKHQVAFREYISPILFDNQELAGFVRLGFSTAEITKKWQGMLVTTLWVTFILIAVACLLVYFPIKRIIYPLYQLSEGAIKVGQGDLDFKICIKSKDEIGHLANNFNDMAQSLRQNSQEIESKTYELKKSERKFRELFENIAQPLYINDTNGKLIDCNQAMVDLFGYESREEMTDSIQGGIFLYMHAEQRQSVTQEIIGKGEVKGLKVEYKKRDGTAINALLTSRVRLNDYGKVIGFEGMIQDVTELRQLEEKLYHSQKMESIGTLAGGIAHDFNNLLAAIMSSAELAKKYKADPNIVEKYLNHIDHASTRAAELTKNLLGFARKGQTRIEKIDVGALAAEVESLLRETIDRRVHLHTDVPQGIWPTMGNPSQIHQVLMNLCINAKDAILDGDGHEIKVSISNSFIDQEFLNLHPDAVVGSYVLINVADDGNGISESIKNKIFDPFFTTKDVGKGTGLGLATVYGIVKNHGGFLYLDSKEGKGTTFHIYLPANFTEAQLEDSNYQSKSQNNLNNKPIVTDSSTILFVDDEEVLRMIGSEFLESCGYKVLLASNGKEALDMFASNDQHIDLAILDLMMPKMGGEETLENIKRLYPHVPAVIASGYSKESLNQKMKFQQYDGFIEKPYSLEKLAQLVSDLLNKA